MQTAFNISKYCSFCSCKHRWIKSSSSFHFNNFLNIPCAATTMAPTPPTLAAIDRMCAEGFNVLHYKCGPDRMLSVCFRGKRQTILRWQSRKCTMSIILCQSPLPLSTVDFLAATVRKLCSYGFAVHMVSPRAPLHLHEERILIRLSRVLREHYWGSRNHVFNMDEVPMSLAQAQHVMDIGKEDLELLEIS